MMLEALVLGEVPNFLCEAFATSLDIARAVHAEKPQCVIRAAG
jgi:hypothetical protein